MLCIQLYTEKLYKKNTILTLFSKNILNGDKRDKRDYAILKAFACDIEDPSQSWHESLLPED